MKKLMKFTALLLAFVTLIACLTACTKPDNGTNENVVVVTATNAADNVTLDAHMIDSGVDFKVTNGMVTEINGKANTTNSFWMLYTSDTENSNTAWGSYEHEGKTLGSAALGATELVVKNGCVYVWVYETF